MDLSTILEKFWNYIDEKMLLRSCIIPILHLSMQFQPSAEELRVSYNYS